MTTCPATCPMARSSRTAAATTASICPICIPTAPETETLSVTAMAAPELTETEVSATAGWAAVMTGLAATSARAGLLCTPEDSSRGSERACKLSENACRRVAVPPWMMTGGC